MNLQRYHWTLLLLAASLGLNLFLGGMWTARQLRQPSTSEMLGPLSLRQLGESLPPTARPALRRVQHTHRERIRNSMTAVEQTRRSAVGSLTAEPLDRTKALQDLEAFRNATNQAQAHIHEALVDLAEELSPDDRRKLSRTLREHPKGRGQARGRPSAGPFP